MFLSNEVPKQMYVVLLWAAISVLKEGQHTGLCCSVHYHLLVVVFVHTTCLAGLAGLDFIYNPARALGRRIQSSHMCIPEVAP